MRKDFGRKEYSGTNTNTYVCRDADMCLFLMDMGFSPYRIARDRLNPDKDVYLFTGSDSLFRSVIDYGLTK